ncbi:MAG: Hsp70 family protein, partial [Candidatus Cloacimonetes bacterium]|nr:Hsp70 family protein [Candidatus Cloacimonadota bacterium]
RGLPQIEVSFDIDANGILNVSAKDKATGKEQKITITASSGLSDEEIEKMKKDAESHAEEDKKKKEKIEVKNKGENLIYTAEKALKEAGDKVKPEAKRKVEDKIMQLKNVLEKDNIEEIKKMTDELSTAIQEVGTQMYQGSDVGGQKSDVGNQNKKEQKNEKTEEQKKEKDSKDNKQEAEKK